VPSTYNPDQPTPLVVGLHGRFSNGASHASLTDTNEAAEEHGFIALYPDGLSYGPPGDYGWNYTRGAGPYPEQGVDDVAFILSLIDDIAIDLNIDRQRIYVDGMSNGGFMVHRLACDVPTVFAGFASVAGSGFEGLETVCARSEHAPVPMLIIHGTQDNNVLWDGRSQNIGGRQFYGSIPIIRMLGFWAQYNGCSDEIDTQTLTQQGQSPETEVRIVNVLGCNEGSAVTLYAVVGGGHNWPGTPGRISSAVAGLVNDDIHATDVIWEFFSHFTRPSTSNTGA
jgi:polyhydroxybutyrate depolymerase